MEFTITLSDAQYKALAHVVYDPQEWIENAVYERCRRAIDEIYDKEIEKLKKENKPTSDNKYEVVMNADIKTGKQIQDDYEKLKGL
jgi:hypothetical protein